MPLPQVSITALPCALTTLSHHGGENARGQLGYGTKDSNVHSQPATVTLPDFAQGKTFSAIDACGVRSAALASSPVWGFSSISISAQSLSPTFQTTLKNYTATVPDRVSSISVTSTSPDGTATIKVNDNTVGNGVASSQIDLAHGSNTITVQLISSDGQFSSDYTLKINRTHTVAVSSNGNGKVFGAGEYIPGDVAEITAIPDSGYRFVGWQGSVSSEESTLTLIVDQRMTLSAVFEPDMSDSDGDGISNYRELTIYHTDPNNPDTDGDGMSDLFEGCAATNDSGTSTAPAIGNKVAYALNLPELSGKLKFLGKLPTGLIYDPVSGELSGHLTGKPGVYTIKAQLTDENGKLQTLSLSYTIAPFPRAFVGSYQALTEDEGLHTYTGLMDFTITEAGAWNFTLSRADKKGIIKLSGNVELGTLGENAFIRVSLPAKKTADSLDAIITLEPNNSLVTGGGAWPGNSFWIRGHRLVRKGELEMQDTALSFAFDQGSQNGNNVPAGFGWATGKFTASTGTVSLSGLLGDAQPFKATMKLSVTGQAILWAQPYGNPSSSFFAGFVSLRDLVSGESADVQPYEMSWYVAPRLSAKSYLYGFGPLAVTTHVSPYSAPLNANAMAVSLGLSGPQMTVNFGDDSLRDAVKPLTLPEMFYLNDRFALVAGTNSDQQLVSWSGKLSRKDGTFLGSVRLGAPVVGSGFIAGRGVASGVVIQNAAINGKIGAGLIQVPVAGSKGSFITLPITMGE